MRFRTLPSVGLGLLAVSPRFLASLRGLRMMATSAPPGLRVACCQLKVGADKGANIAKARAAVEGASAQGANLVVLPECWNSPYAVTSFPVYAERAPEIGAACASVDGAASPSAAMLCQVARDKKIWLVGGSIPERDESNKLFNTCLVIDPTGKVVGKHRKVHLFDIDVPGKITFKESDSLSPGNAVTVVDTPWGGVGVGICYDIRFPELAFLMRQKGCSLLVYPGAFNMVTGPAHWELLQRARAVDNQLYVVTCSPARDATGGGYVAWGHSSIISPWGEVVQAAGADEATVVADLDLAAMLTVRDNIPCWKQQRFDTSVALKR